MRFLLEKGYYKNSMSNNARKAYENSIMPWSKWTKQAVISEIANQLGVDDEDITLLKPYKEYLVYSSWHHTSKNYNKTDFWKVEFDPSEIIVSSEAQDQINKEKIKHLISKSEDNIKVLQSLGNEYIVKPTDNSYIIEFKDKHPYLQNKFELLSSMLTKEQAIERALKARQKEINEWIDIEQKLIQKYKMQSITF